VIVDTREIYKEIQERTKEIKAIQQLLDGRYRMYVKRDPIRDKEILEMGFLAKSCYSRFEYILMQIEEKAKAKEKEKAREREKAKELESWVRSEENQRKFSKYLMTLKSPEHEAHKGTGLEATEVKDFMLIVVKGIQPPLTSCHPISLERDRHRRPLQCRRTAGGSTHHRQGSLSQGEDSFVSSPNQTLLQIEISAPAGFVAEGMQTSLAHGVEKQLREMVEGEIRVLSL